VKDLTDKAVADASSLENLHEFAQLMSGGEVDAETLRLRLYAMLGRLKETLVINKALGLCGDNGKGNQGDGET